MVLSCLWGNYSRIQVDSHNKQLNHLLVHNIHQDTDIQDHLYSNDR